MTPWIAGRQLQVLNRVGTGLFVLTAVAAALSSGPVRVVAVLVALALFIVGTGAMLVAFFAGVSRSRTEVVSVASLFLLLGSVPKAIAREFHVLTLVQVVTGVATASMALFTSVAFGILVPMLGLGISALWAAWFGTFPPREDLDHKRPEHARPSAPPPPTASFKPAAHLGNESEPHNG